MEFLRNPEIKKQAIIYLSVTAVLTVFAFLADIVVGLIVLAVCLIFLALTYFTTRSRYKKISEFATEIDKILHSNGEINFNEYAEGELSVLHNQVKKLTMQLKQNEALIQGEKEYLTDSIADISHQIRTPLTSINLILSMLSDGELTDEERRNYVNKLLKLLDKIDWLVNSLLKISKLDAGTANLVFSDIKLKKVVDDALNPLLIPIELKNINIVKKIDEDAVFYGDCSWTAEAIGNIIKNCMEHTPEGGTVYIEALENRVYSEIVISDTGFGIDPEDLPHLFERFYRGKDSGGQSVGIGLALARSIIKRQNGTVKAENGSTGAKFTVKFYRMNV